MWLVSVLAVSRGLNCVVGYSLLFGVICTETVLYSVVVLVALSLQPAILSTPVKREIFFFFLLEISAQNMDLIFRSILKPVILHHGQGTGAFSLTSPGSHATLETRLTSSQEELHILRIGEE